MLVVLYAACGWVTALGMVPKWAAEADREASLANHFGRGGVWVPIYPEGPKRERYVKTAVHRTLLLWVAVWPIAWPVEVLSRVVDKRIERSPEHLARKIRKLEKEVFDD